MSYTVLARRYRSTTFDEVVGQSHVAQTLKKAIASDRIAHAFLFCGTRGTGKTSMARILAKALNCQKFDKPTTTPCGECESCKSIARGDGIDVIEIDAASNTGVDDVRGIIENSRYTPTTSRFKIYIIDEVHMLSKNAFNALLKTLEEPPSHVKFILATTETEKILPTILSRCQRYDFRNIPTREIAAHLKSVCKTEKVTAEDDAILLVAKAGAGSMRDALSLLDRLLSVGEKKLTVAGIEEMLGMPRSQVIFDLVQHIGGGDVKATLEAADTIINSGMTPDTLIASLVDHVRNLLILRACGPKSGLVEVPGLPPEDLANQAAKFETPVLSQDITILEELRRQIRQGGAGRALLDAALVRLTLAEQFTNVDDMLNEVDTAPANATPVNATVAQKKNDEPVSVAPAEDGPAEADPPLEVSASSSSFEDDDDSLPAPGKVWEGPSVSLATLMKQHEAKAAASVPPPEAPNIEAASSSDLGGLWSRLLHELAQSNPTLPPLLAGARLSNIEAGTATLQFPSSRDFSMKLLDRNGKKDTIRDVLSALLNKPTGLKLEIDLNATEEPPPPRPAPAARPAAAPQRSSNNPAPTPQQQIPDNSIRLTPELKAELQQDPLVAAVIAELGAEIVRVEQSTNS